MTAVNDKAIGDQFNTENSQLILRALQIIRENPPTMELFNAIDLPDQLDMTFYDALPVLRCALNDSNEEVLVFALKAIINIDSECVDDLPQIIRLSTSKSMRVRKLAVSPLRRATGDLVPHASEALRCVVTDMWAYIGVRYAAFSSLIKLRKGVLSALKYIILG